MTKNDFFAIPLIGITQDGDIELFIIMLENADSMTVTVIGAIWTSFWASIVVTQAEVRCFFIFLS